MQKVGPEPDVALMALRKKEAELSFIATGGEVKPNEEQNETRITLANAIKDYLDDCRDRQGKSGYGLAKTTVEAYRHRLGYLTQFEPKVYLDEVDTAFIKRFRKFLLNHPDDLGDRSCYNAMQAVSTFLLKYDIAAAKKILKEMSFPPKPIIPYTKEALTKFFGACTDEEERIFKFFLHSMGREREVAFCEKRDLLFDVNVLHISPKPDKGFRLKGKRSGQAKKGRKVPINAVFMTTMKKHCEGKGPRDLVFPNGKGGVQNHFLRFARRSQSGQAFPIVTIGISIVGGRPARLAIMNLASQ